MKKKLPAFITFEDKNTESVTELFRLLCSVFGFQPASGHQIPYWVEWGLHQYKGVLAYTDGSLYHRDGGEGDTVDVPNFVFPRDYQKLVDYMSGKIKIAVLQPIVVAGVGEYEATIRANGYVSVGCQSVSFAKVKEIAKAVEEIEKTQK